MVETCLEGKNAMTSVSTMHRAGNSEEQHECKEYKYKCYKYERNTQCDHEIVTKCILTSKMNTRVHV